MGNSKTDSRLDLLEESYMNGIYDDVAGDVDTINHFYRIGKYIVETDQQGFRTLHEFESVSKAIACMDYYHGEEEEADG